MPTIAERLTMKNYEIHRQIEKTAHDLSRRYVKDIVKAVDEGHRYRPERDTTRETKRVRKKLRYLVEKKKKMDF